MKKKRPEKSKKKLKKLKKLWIINYNLKNKMKKPSKMILIYKLRCGKKKEIYGKLKRNELMKKLNK